MYIHTYKEYLIINIASEETGGRKWEKEKERDIFYSLKKLQM